MEMKDIPFADMLRIRKLNGGACELEFDASNRNHLGTMHASAQFAVAETASGMFLLERYPQFEGRAMPVLRESKTKFKRPAHSSVVAVPSVIDEDATNFLTQLESKGRGIIDISVEVRDTQGEVTLLAEFKWFVQRIT